MLNKDFRSPVVALVMARAMKRVAGKHGDLGLAREAKSLHKEAMKSIQLKKQSALSARRLRNSEDPLA
jgi:hypothetical protein